MPVEPVPISPTRCPVKSTPSRGHRLVWYHGPANDSTPGSAGTWYADRQPTASTQNSAVRRAPSSVVTTHSDRPGSHVAPVTRVLSWINGQSPNRSATWFRYRSTSGCAGYRSLHDHSCSSSGENE